LQRFGTALLHIGFKRAGETPALPASRKMRTAREIAQLAQRACILEVCARKPGNVSRDHDFSDTSFVDFLISAIAIGPALENAVESRVGQIIWQAASDTRRLVRPNTNLGLILLLAPLVKACLGASCFGSMRQSLSSVLNALSIEDARLAYAAIRLAQPGGLGQVSEADVAEEPSITLLRAMVLAQSRDSIASEYATGFSITFEIGLPALKQALSEGADLSNAAVQAYLTILGRIPDTLIARKRGFETARQISLHAREVLGSGGIFTSRGQEAILEMDKRLLDPNHTLNPGTTADLTAAAIFLVLIE
jgi:triphosphoribosyl-dephospho-CoA synthase